LPPQNPPLAQNIQADVAIIGAGFTGLAAAFYIRQQSPSKKVVLLEASRCGNGASGRNGAMMLTLTDDRYMVLGSDLSLDKKIYDLTVDNAARLKIIAASVSSVAPDPEIETSGALEVLNTGSDVEDGKRYVAKANQAGIPVEFWDVEKTASIIGTRAYPGALFDPHSGQVHPGKLVAVLKAAAESAGATIYETSPVVRIEEGPTHKISTASGFAVTAPSLVLATNAYSSKLGYLRRAVSPVFDYVGMTAPLSDSLLAGIGWQKPIPFNDSRTEVYYLGLTRDGRIHIGGGPVDYVFNNGVVEPKSTAHHFTRLSAELARIFPKLDGVPFETTWGGCVDMSLDQSPSVGVIGKHKNIFYAIGFSGHGVGLTSLFARILADLELRKTADWSWLPFVNRLPPYIPNEPFRWLGIHSALAYYRATDAKTP
jgi:glycine/D-amino acid oxidase-like deaminating enzyme